MSRFVTERQVKARDVERGDLVKWFDGGNHLYWLEVLDVLTDAEQFESLTGKKYPALNCTAASVYAPASREAGVRQWSELRIVSAALSFDPPEFAVFRVVWVKTSTLSEMDDRWLIRPANALVTIQVEEAA